MSCCLTLQTRDFIVVGVDSAVVEKENQQIKRVSETGKKFFKLNNMGIFCSGNFDYVQEVISYIESDDDIGILEIQNFVKKHEFAEIEIMIFYQNSIFQISTYNNFELITHKNPPEGIQIFSGGVKNKEALNKAEELITKGIQNPIEVILETFKHIECPEVGGVITIYKIDKKINCIHSEKLNNLTKTENFIIGEIVVGKLLAGNSLEITNEGANFLLDDTGCTLANATFTITNSKTKITLDASSGISIQTLSGYTWSSVFGIDTSGNLYFKGDLTGSSGTFSGSLSGGAILGGTIDIGTSSGGIPTVGNGLFSVASTGAVTASNLNITGGTITIGDNFKVDKYGNITARSITLTNGTLENGTLSGSTLEGGAILGGTLDIGTNSGGIPTLGNGLFSVNRYGQCTATNLKITGGSINLNNGAFQVTSSGTVYATGSLYVGSSGSGYLMSLSNNALSINGASFTTTKDVTVGGNLQIGATSNFNTCQINFGSSGAVLSTTANTLQLSANTIKFLGMSQRALYFDNTKIDFSAYLGAYAQYSYTPLSTDNYTFIFTTAGFVVYRGASVQGSVFYGA